MMVIKPSDPTDKFLGQQTREIYDRANRNGIPINTIPPTGDMATDVANVIEENNRLQRLLNSTND